MVLKMYKIPALLQFFLRYSSYATPQASHPLLAIKSAFPPSFAIPAIVLQAAPPGTESGCCPLFSNTLSITLSSTRVIPPFFLPTDSRKESFSLIKRSMRAEPTPVTFELLRLIIGLTDLVFGLTDLVFGLTDLVFGLTDLVFWLADLIFELFCCMSELPGFISALLVFIFCTECLLSHNFSSF
ncbi:hypothetical protein MTBBW1_2210019 [Desulfamplus magnetovallimortis]|uniref:Uncharacterized protein n=1 Tax=Desulfamplus magnetovallimortis TaxID=1246637 RepID=A0A1W1HDG4_9BACT|nr:hypothetical protein MTBBW1_2210019 [Desulfamplus magnetovallimortis]